MKYHWLLFDADNTLFDFTNASRQAFEIVFTRNGFDFEENHYKQYKVVNDQVWREFEKGEIDAVELRSKRFQLFFDQAGITANPGDFNRDYLQELVLQTRLLDGTLELLQYLHGQYKMAIITNGLREVQRPRINHVRLGHFFDTIIVSDEIGHAKPHTDFFEYTFAQIQHPDPTKVLVIGDSLHSDIQGGINYGLDTCWYNPVKSPNPTEIVPKYEIHRLRQLIEVVEN